MWGRSRLGAAASSAPDASDSRPTTVRRARSPPPSRRSPTRSAIRPAAASTCSPARPSSGVTAANVADRVRAPPERRPPPPRQARRRRIPRGRDRARRGLRRRPAVEVLPRRVAGVPRRPRAQRRPGADVARQGAGDAAARARPRRWPSRSGMEYGAAMAAGLTGSDLAAGQRSLRSALHAVADALTAHGFAAHTDSHHDSLRIINNHCPFGDVAIEHPVICAVDRGMVKGMLQALYGGDAEPLARGVAARAATPSASPPSDRGGSGRLREVPPPLRWSARTEAVVREVRTPRAVVRTSRSRVQYLHRHEPRGAWCRGAEQGRSRCRSRRSSCRTPVRARRSCRSRRAASATPTCTTARAGSTTTSRSCSGTRRRASSSRSARASRASRPGDFVVLNWRAVCGTCRSCLRGRPWYCFSTFNATQKMTLHGRHGAVAGARHRRVRGEDARRRRAVHEGRSGRAGRRGGSARLRRDGRHRRGDQHRWRRARRLASRCSAAAASATRRSPARDSPARGRSSASTSTIASSRGRRSSARRTPSTRRTRTRSRTSRASPAATAPTCASRPSATRTCTARRSRPATSPARSCWSACRART